MRAGKLDKAILILVSGDTQGQAPAGLMPWIPGWWQGDLSQTTTVDDLGTPTFQWFQLAKVRAEMLQLNTTEFLAAQGEVESTVVAFRIRWRSSLQVSMRVECDRRLYDVREVKEIGRRRGLELRCEEVRS